MESSVDRIVDRSISMSLWAKQGAMVGNSDTLMRR